MTPQLLEGRLRRAFLELTPAQMRDVLEEYDDAVNQKGDEIRNHAAYLFGVVKRYKALHQRSGTGDPLMPQGNNLSDRVQVSSISLSSPAIAFPRVDARSTFQTLNYFVILL